MSDLQLISHPLCPYVQRAVIVLTEKNMDHQRTYIDLADKPDWFAPISPLGRVPILKTAGTVLFESQVIAEYLDEITPLSLHPEDPLQKARHRSWIEFGSETLGAIAGFYTAKDAAAFDKKRQALREKFARIEPEITGPFFDGNRFHLIDGVWGPLFRYLDSFDDIADFGFLQDLKKTTAWRSLLSTRPSIVTAVPDGYPARLKTFLKNRNSYLSGLMG
ncbi:glutathione S-transferase family protein [Sneathiella marina]|uniref:Glutathione S-transferase family protein n=1 Tax=Sneathiella marina TaxID=2950108 RepID=A0ABY4W0E7_9PROT|nr:glutathione S-transferase family protein [Sneathiella marina]USG60558.1 glutathione S-transferase family protein [Sneathiella marina]